MDNKSSETREFTDEERKRLVDFINVLIEIDQKEKARFARLKDCPTGFAMKAEGHDCGLCGNSVWSDTSGWFDKWGFKCANCQDAVNKRRIPNGPYMIMRKDNPNLPQTLQSFYARTGKP